METIEIPVYLVRTLTPEGYFERINEMVGASGFSNYYAFETLEAERQQYFLPRKYSDFWSFKRAKSYHTRRLIRVNTE